MPPTVIRVRDVSKKFTINENKSLKERLVNFGRSRANAQEFWALRGVSFDVHSGTTLGLIGANGSGKSTLLKIIGGILTPNEGYVERRGRLAALLELGAGFHGDLTGRENVYLNASILGLTKAQTARYFDEIVEFSGIEEFIDTQVKFYSSGMYVRLAFAVAVHVDPEILLVDEVLAVGDEAFQRKCMARIKQFQREGRTIVFVTHGMDQVRELCDRVVMLRQGVVKVDGDPVDALRALRELFEEREERERELHPERESAQAHRLRISDVTVTDGAGTPISRYEPRAPFAIEFTVQSDSRCDDWVAGVAVENHLGQLMYGVNTHLMDRELPPIEGRRRVRYSFKELPLPEGSYQVTVAVHGVNGPEYHRINGAVGFKVFSTLRQDGPVYMEPSVDVRAE